MLGEFEKVRVKSVTTPFLSLSVELQRALMVNHNLCDVDLTEKAIQRVSEVTVNNVKYAVRDVLHSERIPLFWQIKYIFNIDTMWLLCGKMLIPLSYDRQFHACSVKVDKEWTLLKPGDEMDFQTNDTYSVDDCLYVTVRHCVLK